MQASHIRGKAWVVAQEVTVQFNMCNEPWSKYSMQGVADRGLKPAQLTSARLHREVLFVETFRCAHIGPYVCMLEHPSLLILGSSKVWKHFGGPIYHLIVAANDAPCK